MIRCQFEEEVRYRLRGRPHLVPVFHDVFEIAGRLREIIPDLFVVFNTATQRYEVHSLAHHPETLALNLPYAGLDARALHDVLTNSIRHHGMNVLRRVAESEERMQAAQRREWHNWVQDVARETKSKFARTAWGA